MWCSSNSLIDDSIWLRLFQHTLTYMAMKWYIELPWHSFVDFSALEIIFLTHFQLPIHYETGTYILTSLRQNTSTHISDHIHEWRWQRWLIKAPIPNQLLADWFTKSLLPPIAWDVAMAGAFTKEQAISCTQYLDLVYSQSITLYDLTPQVACPRMDLAKPPTETPIDGVVSSIQPSSVAKTTKQHNSSATTRSTPTVSTNTWK